MTKEMKLQNEVLTMENLDEVNGGTCDQLHELTKAFLGNMQYWDLQQMPQNWEVSTKQVVSEIFRLPTQWKGI